MVVEMTEGGLKAKFSLSRGERLKVDIELDIEAGQTLALLGPNGAGKSTVVEALAGLLPIESGRIELAGQTLDAPRANVLLAPEKRRIGVVFQNYLLFDHLSVIDNVAFGPRSSGLSKKDARLVARQWIDTLGLSDLADHKPGQMSGGQAQRVALARALATEPDLLLLDEPLAALDVSTRTQLRRTLLTHLSGYSGPRLLITHDPTDAFLLADRIMVIEGGKLTQVGSPDQIRRSPSTPYVAALAGLNLLAGTNSQGSLALDDHAQPLRTSDTQTNGAVLITIRPNAVALHSEQPHGSPRNTWQTSIATLEPLGDITRVTLADPLPLSVDITPGAATSMGLTPGCSTWASIKATEINLSPA